MVTTRTPPGPPGPDLATQLEEAADWLAATTQPYNSEPAKGRAVVARLRERAKVVREALAGPTSAQTRRLCGPLSQTAGEPTGTAPGEFPGSDVLEAAAKVSPACAELLELVTLARAAPGKTCPTCGGKGHTWVSIGRRGPPRAGESKRQPCVPCGGAGKRPTGTETKAREP